MADRKRPKDVGSDSPGSRIAKDQRVAGLSSGPQEARDAPKMPKQPPQTSNRPSAAQQQEPTVRKGYEQAQNPEAQGDGDPGPEQVSERSSQQGHAGRSHTGRVRPGDGAEQSQKGLPGSGHTREGRQHVPGDRDPHQPL